MRIFANLLHGVAAALALSSAFVFAAQPGVAFVTDLKGEARIDSQRATLMSEVAEGQKLVLGNGAGVTLMFIQSGEEFQLPGPGDYQVRGREVVAVKPDGARIVKRPTPWRTETTHLVNVAKTATASLRMRGITPTNDGKGLRLLSPSGKVANLNPVLRWQGDTPTPFRLDVTLEGVSIFASDKAASPYTLPVKLLPGRVYAWTVSASGQSVAAEFETLGVDELKRLNMLRPRVQSTFSDRLLYAVTLQGLGATGEARELFAQLAAVRPDLPELANLAGR